MSTYHNLCNPVECIPVYPIHWKSLSQDWAEALIGWPRSWPRSSFSILLKVSQRNMHKRTRWKIHQVPSFENPHCVKVSIVQGGTNSFALISSSHLFRCPFFSDFSHFFQLSFELFLPLSFNLGQRPSPLWLFWIFVQFVAVGENMYNCKDLECKCS